MILFNNFREIASKLVLLIVATLTLSTSQISNSHTKKILKFESSQEQFNPVFYSILRFLGKNYLSYKLGEIFEFIENEISDFASEHLKKIWLNYDNVDSNNIDKYNDPFKIHYNKCGICSKVGDLMTKEEYYNDLFQLKIKINQINIQSSQEIHRLEKILNMELKKINSSFISLENKVIEVERKTIENEGILKKQGEKIGDMENKVIINSNNIKEWSTPRILILRDNNSYLKNIIYIKDNYFKYEIVIQDIVPHKNPRIILVNDRMLTIAQSLSKELNLDIIPFNSSGIYGSCKFDIILYL